MSIYYVSASDNNADLPFYRMSKHMSAGKGTGGGGGRGHPPGTHPPHNMSGGLFSPYREYIFPGRTIYLNYAKDNATNHFRCYSIGVLRGGGQGGKAPCPP